MGFSAVWFGGWEPLTLLGRKIEIGRRSISGKGLGIFMRIAPALQQEERRSFRIFGRVK